MATDRQRMSGETAANALSPSVLWLDAVRLLDPAPLPDARLVAVVANLEDAKLRSLTNLDATPEDLVDARRPAAGPRDYFLRRRALTRHLVARLQDGAPNAVVIAYDEAGAPRLRAPAANFFVSVAARGPLAAVAVAQTPLGIDIEISGTARAPLREVLHPRERAIIEAAWRENGDALPFLRLWTAKEAYLKALGSGFMRDPASILVEMRHATGFKIVDDANPDQQAFGFFQEAEIAGQSIIAAALAL
jgi:phosphopantetheinyl transferase